MHTMKKILVVDESPLFREYLQEKLKSFGFEVILAVNGLDAMIKMRGDIPDLIIMDYYLTRKSSMEILQEKQANPNTKNVPVILSSNKIDKRMILEVAKFNVKKFMPKPIKIDALLSIISELLGGMKLEVDDTPCIIEAHFNDEILFIEVARGLNGEKLDLLKFKITELLQLYKRKLPKVLMIMSDITLGSDDTGKLTVLIRNVLETTGSPQRVIKILTSCTFIKGFIADHEEFNKIEVTDNLSKAMDTFLGLNVSDFVDEGKDVMAQDFLASTSAGVEPEGSIDLRYAAEQKGNGSDAINRHFNIAAVDDDLVIRELLKTVFSERAWNVETFENGKIFVEALPDSEFDLIFLDLMMPEMDGFQVLQHMKDKGIDTPVIVFSALSRKETVVQVVGMGVISYLIKPIKPDELFDKVREFLKMNF